MKITKEHIDVIYRALDAALERSSYTSVFELVRHYTDHGLGQNPTLRAIWDLFRSASVDGESSITWFCDTIYPYAEDVHMHTVLLRYVKDNT